MQKAYKILDKYAKMLTMQDYPVGNEAKLYIQTEQGVFTTKDNADLATLTIDDIEKLPSETLPIASKGYKAMIISQTPYCQECLRDMRGLKPSLDDMAQIIGPVATILDGRIMDGAFYRDLRSTLGRSTGCFILKGADEDGYAKGYTITAGRTLYEAVVALTVLEKTAEITLLADKIGGVKHIRPFESKVMHLVYQQKYSKAEDAAKEEEFKEGICDTPDSASAASEAGSKKTNEQILREKLVEHGKKLVATGLVQGTWGNLSAKLDDTYMLVTPSGLDYMRLTPSDMVKVNIETLEYEGSLKPTSEKGLHAAVYKQRPDVGSVIHTHSKYCCVFAAAQQHMPITEPEDQKIFGKDVRLAGYAIPGSKKLMANSVAALGENFGCIMSNHGMIACGADLEAAFDNCVKLEECGKRYLDAL